MATYDARAARTLQPGEHLTVPDAPGLRLVCSPTGRAWVYRYESPVSKLMKQYRIGPVSLPEAMWRWAELKAIRDAGRCPVADRKVVRVEALTVRQVCDGFAGVAKRKEKGLRELRRIYATMVPPAVATLAAKDVTRSVAYDLVQSHAGTPVVAGNLRREMGAAWDWAIDSGRLPQDTPNWWRLVLRGKLASKGKVVAGAHQGVLKVALTRFEVGSLLGYLPSMTELERDLLTMYLWTGCRGAEICPMRADEVAEEPDGWWWTIPKVKTKNARHAEASDLRVPLVGRALEVVKRRMGSAWLFPATRHNSKLPHVQQKVIGVAVWHHRDAMPVRPFAPHDLRRTVRTQLAEMGCEKDVAESVLGHMLPGVEGVYNKYRYDKERRMWLTRLSEVWEMSPHCPR